MASYYWPTVAASGVTSLDGMTGAITLTQGTGITITDGVGTITIASTSAGDVTLANVGSSPNAKGASISSQVLTLQPANTSFPGVLLAADWNTFNAKQAALSITNLTDVGTDGITIGNGTGAVIGASPVTISQHVASATFNGYLSSTDWSTFNGKQASGSYITALTGDVTASGPGSVAATLAATTNATLTTISSLVSVGTITTGTWSATTIAVNKGGTGLTSGTSGGILAYTGTGTLASSGLLTANQLLIGGGAGVAPSALAAGSQYVPLTMGASNPGYTALALNQSAATSGQLLNSRGGTGQDFSASTGAISVSSGTFSAGTLSVANGGTGLASGTSGGILGYTASGTLASSIALTASALVLGGGAGATPTPMASLGTTTTVLHGNAAGAPTFGAVSLTADVSGALPLANGGTNNSLTAVQGGVVVCGSSSFSIIAAGSSGQYVKSNGTSAPAFASFAAPTIQKFTSSSGTYTTPTSPAPIYIRIVLVGGGGGGGGGGTAAGAAGSNGGASTFGTALISAGGGSVGTLAGTATAGGTSSLGSGPIGIALPGGAGQGSGENLVSGDARVSGGQGGSSAFGGAGGGGLQTSAGGAGGTNTGGGGGGAGGTSAALSFSGSGGGSGGYVDAIIASPAASYAYAVGAGGNGEAAGTGGTGAGGAGGSGIVVVYEYYA